MPISYILFKVMKLLKEHNKKTSISKGMLSRVIGEFLIESLKDLNNNYSNIKLLIVGDGPDKEKYEMFAKEKGLDKEVIFAGKIASDDMPYYYHVANVFATASTTETQGLTVIEAMASSLVPICIEDEAFNSINPQSQKDMGKIMGAVTPKLKGKADMSFVSKTIKEKLASIC